jgi:hypothetical protein
VPVYLHHRYGSPVRAESTPKPAEETADAWRFRLEVPPRSTHPFEVTEVHGEIERVHVPGISVAQVAVLSDRKLVSAQARAALEAIAEAAARIQELERERNDKAAREKRAEGDQARLRENLKSLGKTEEEAQLRKRYVKSLGDLEEQLAALRAEGDALARRIDESRADLKKRVEAFSL